jgi:hypothetical protein
MDSVLNKYSGLDNAGVAFRTKKFGQNSYKVKQINILLVVIKVLFSHNQFSKQ